MRRQKPQLFLIDFDSTFITREGLDELAKVALKKHPQQQKILSQIESLTKQGMEGTLPFGESLKQRIALLQADNQHIEKTVKILKKQISPSILHNKDFFKKNKQQIYIISGGFKELIIPVVKPFGIAKDHIFANTFTFDKQDNIIGIDTKNLLSQTNGKQKLLKSLKLPGEITVIGDGYTDYQLKESGLVKRFIAFTENVEREAVIKKADEVVHSFDEFLFSNNLPMSISYPKSKISVLMLENIDKEAVEIFEKEGYHVTFYEKSFAEEELIKKIKNTSILCVRSRTAVTPTLLAHAPHLLAVGTYTIGTNHLHLPSLTEKGIAAFYAPYSSTRSVVELVIGEIIMLMRHVFEKSSKMHQGVWDKTAKGNHELRGKTLGIIGYGNIGTQVGLIAETLGMKVIFYDTIEKPIFGNAERCDNLSHLLKRADMITIHVDGNKNNTNLIGEKEFALMKDGVSLINASRGFVVDHQALVKYLAMKKIRAAAIDVFPKEPKSNQDPFISELISFPNVILTPHIGGSTVEAQRNIAQFVTHKIIDYINSGNTYLSVNLPNMQIPNQQNHHRLLHIHKNVPGILAKINNVFAEHHINILGQYLKTNEEVGYVITDVDKKHDNKIIDVLKHIPDTIRFRVLY